MNKRWRNVSCLPWDSEVTDTIEKLYLCNKKLFIIFILFHFQLPVVLGRFFNVFLRFDVVFNDYYTNDYLVYDIYFVPPRWGRHPATTDTNEQTQHESSSSLTDRWMKWTDILFCSFAAADWWRLQLLLLLMLMLMRTQSIFYSKQLTMELD